MALKFKNIVSVTSLGMIASETLHIVKGPKRPYIRGDKQLGGGQSEFSPSTSEVIGFAHFPLSINSGLSRLKLRVNVALSKQNSKQQEEPPLPRLHRRTISAFIGSIFMRIQFGRAVKNANDACICCLLHICSLAAMKIAQL